MAFLEGEISMRQPTGRRLYGCLSSSKNSYKGSIGKFSWTIVHLSSHNLRSTAFRRHIKEDLYFSGALWVLRSGYHAHNFASTARLHRRRETMRCRVRVGLRVIWKLSIGVLLSYVGESAVSFPSALEERSGLLEKMYQYFPHELVRYDTTKTLELAWSHIVRFEWLSLKCNPCLFEKAKYFYTGWTSH